MSDAAEPVPPPGADDEPVVDGTSATIDAVSGSASHRSTPGAAAAEGLPRAIGRFQVSRTLGTGGMGVVYLAEDPALGRKVAIKLLHAERAHQGGAQARLQREARALASLSHPNVVVVHEVGIHDDQVYLVMEYVSGPTLREWARARAGDWKAIVAQYRAAGEGLAAAHRAGIIHRDFKPDNVIVDEDGRPRVLDFGLAAAGVEPRSKDMAWDELGTLDLTKTGAILGTPAYMAPEQYLGAPIDARTDQFAFCVALWEGLFGRRPFGGDDLAELRSRVIAGRMRQPPARSPVPRSIVAALTRGLATEPEQRFASMSELLQALADERRSPRRPWLAVGVGGLAAAAVVGLLARAPTLEPASAPPVAADPAPSAPEPAAAPTAPEAPTLVSRQLTHTTGFGVPWASTGARERVVTYSLSDAESKGATWWRLPLSPADARPIALPFPGEAVVHPAPDESYWIVDHASIRRVRADGTVERTIARPGARGEAIGRASWLALDGKSLAIATDTGFEIWDLTGARAEPVRVHLGTHPAGLAWSPDGSRIAVTVSAGLSDHFRLDVFATDGSLWSSTPWPDAMGGKPLRGLVWLPAGLVVLVSNDATAWVQCATLTDAGITPGRRSAGMATSPFTRLVDVVDGHTLLALWPDVQGHLVVLDVLGERAQPSVPFQAIRRNKGGPAWRSDSTLAYLAADPPGALVQLHLEDAARPEVLAPGPYEWASDDGEGGLLLGSADGRIEHWPAGAAAPHGLRLPGIGSTHPFPRCRSARDCIMSAVEANDDAFFGVDLEREQVQRRFLCPPGALCRARWGRAHAGTVLLVDEQQRELRRLSADTGESIGKPRPAPPWAIVQSATETARGELYVTGMLMGEPPEGAEKHVYLMMRLADDGQYRIVWSSERTWVVRPRASPSGRHLALEGQTFRSELVALELGSLCDPAHPDGPDGSTLP